MDTKKWSSFADGVGASYAIGGPTIEMLSKSWNAVSGHSKMTNYEILSNSNSNNIGYIINSPETESNFFGITTNMWTIRESTKAYGYWLAAPSSKAEYLVWSVSCSSLIGSYETYNSDYGFRPIVIIPKT